MQGFCPLKIKISQFPNGFRLNNYMQYVEQTFCLYGGHSSIIKLDRGHVIMNTQKTSLPSICFNSKGVIWSLTNKQERKKINHYT